MGSTSASEAERGGDPDGFASGAGRSPAGSPPGDAAAGARRARLAAVPALLVAVLAIWEAIAAQRAGAGVPGDEAWARAAAVVRAGHRPGDLIVFAPDWIDPVGRLHLGDLISLGDAARMDAARYDRIWELSIRGARSRDTEGRAPVETRDVGGVVVRRFERAPGSFELRADLRTLVSAARVEGAAARPPAVELAEVGFAPHRCILVVPRPGAPVRITFPALPAGELVGYVGLADVFTRRDERRPGRLTALQAGRALAEVTAGVEDGWLRFAAPVAGGDVTFVAASDGPNRQICFAAEVRR
ncbi:MAG TPA: hypothetical protein VNO30_30740 [Kofleriaceae bacterium]|nr:hypothetical protein [Kofleriaceae bacterium]